MTMIRRIVLLLTLVLGAQCWLAAPAQATLCGLSMNGTCFAIATGNWNAGATWSDTTGGATCSATCTTGPTAGDSVTFDAGTNGKTVTLNVSSSVASFNCTGSSTATLVHNTAVTWTISGLAFNFCSTMTYSPANSITALVTFTNTSGTTVAIDTQSSAGTRAFAAVTINGSGGVFQLSSALFVNRLTNSTSALIVTAGTFTANGQNLNLQNFSGATGTIINMGSGTWSLSGDGTGGSQSLWTSVAGTTVNASTSTVAVTGTGLTNHVITAGGKSLNALTIAANSAGGNVTINTSMTVATLAVSAPGYIILGPAVVLTVTNPFTLTGTPTSPINIFGTPGGGTLTVTNAGTASLAWGAINGLTCSGGATFAFTNVLSQQSSGCGVTAPSAGGGRIIGGTLLRRDLGHANDNRPAFIQRRAS